MSNIVEIKVPDIGGADEVDVIEILVAENDTIDIDQSLITLESDKASMEIPATEAGVVKSIAVKLGDKVTEGSLILTVEATEAPASEPETPSKPVQEAQPESKPEPVAATAPTESIKSQPAKAADSNTSGLASTPPTRTSPTASFGTSDLPLANLPYASPSVRKFARELGVDLTKVTGTGPKQRITHEDVRGFVKQALSGSGAATSAGTGVGLDILDWPKVDFTRFGEIESKPLSRIKKLSGANLHRNWVMIPHVTNNDVADVTDLEKLRKTINQEYKNTDVKLTMLAFLIKAVVAALKKFPEFNASLDGDNLVLKKYFNIGFAADTPNGLVVPVVKDADTKGVVEIAQETSELAALAREGKLSGAQMQGGCFTISSLGGIGGTDFTPIINAPEVAILGVSRSSMQPIWNGQDFIPRLMLPLSLSYDHRVIDGAAAARFNAYLSSLLADFRRITL